MDLLGPALFVLYREVVLSLEVKMYYYNREKASKCVLYREVFSIASFILLYLKKSGPSQIITYYAVCCIEGHGQ